jgi:hypothetical protein
MNLNGTTVTPRETRLRMLLRKVLRDYLIDVPENQGLHGWRCQYPDRYGPCDHFEQLVKELAEELLKDDEEVKTDDTPE